jgi:hypothetical protein
MQAGFTFLGNVACALAAYRIAKSNGWTLDEINPFPKSNTDPTGLIADGIASMPLQVVPTAASSSETKTALLLKVLGLTVLTSYVVKYGELGADVFFTPNPPLALAMVIGIPALTAYNYYNLQQQDNDGDTSNKDWFSFLNQKDGSTSMISMDTVKQYGVAGTVAYVITELAFWIVAFPLAAYALYQSTGHWPDVINDNTDRAAVLAFIFAGANIARVMVPLRLGAALALAPWVDENIIQTVFPSDNKGESTNKEGAVSTTTTTASAKQQPQQSKKQAIDVEIKKPALTSYFMTNKE